MNKTKNSSVMALTECAIMVALSTVLSVLKIFELPYSGSITVASMLPIVVAVYRHGTLWGIGIAATNSAIQLLLGMNALSYAVNWQAAVAIILFDYIFAFSAFALSGIFKGKIKNDATAALLGILLASVLRFICHTAVGCTVWAGISIPTGAALLYSISYNATYMIPETIILALAGVYVFSSLDFSYSIPKRIKRENMDTASSYCALAAGIILLIALIVDVVLVFGVLQNAESGELDFSGIVNVNLPALITSSAIGILIPAILVAVIKTRQKRA